MEWTDFLHTSSNSRRLKVILMIFGWVWPKGGWPFSSCDPKISHILRMNL